MYCGFFASLAGDKIQKLGGSPECDKMERNLAERKVQLSYDNRMTAEAQLQVKPCKEDPIISA